MDGKGRAIDNVFIQRFWRTVKYEKIHLNPPADGLDLYEQLAEYMDYYNHIRRHCSLDERVPAEVFPRLNRWQETEFNTSCILEVK